LHPHFSSTRRESNFLGTPQFITVESLLQLLLGCGRTPVAADTCGHTAAAAELNFVVLALSFLKASTLNSHQMKSRNKYVGKFVETDFEPIDLQFSIASLKHLLDSAVSSNLYTHQQVADWACRFWSECMEGELSQSEDEEIIRAVEIALDVNSHWDMFLYNTYSLEQLQNMNFSQVELPSEWFEKWRAELN
jgi:hypothetical protein